MYFVQVNKLFIQLNIDKFYIIKLKSRREIQGWKVKDKRSSSYMDSII